MLAVVYCLRYIFYSLHNMKRVRKPLGHQHDPEMVVVLTHILNPFCYGMNVSRNVVCIFINRVISKEALSSVLTN